MGITCSRNESFAFSFPSFFFLYWKFICMGIQGKRKKVLYPFLLFGKEKFRRDGRRAKKQKGRRAGA